MSARPHVLILALLLGVPAVAQDQGSRPPPVTQDDPAEVYQELVDEFQEAMASFSEQYRAAADDAAREKLFAEAYPRPEAYAERFLAFASEHAGTSHAAKALTWVVSNVRSGDARKRAMDTLVADHVEDAGMVEVCRALVYDREPGTAGLVRRILEKTPHREVKGVGTFVLALQLKGQAGSKSGEERDELVAEFEALMETCQEEYGDVDFFPGYKSIAVAAQGELFEHRNLQIGMAAPDIVGEDIDGVPFKLSDYRGKVVMLDFWGHW